MSAKKKRKQKPFTPPATAIESPHVDGDPGHGHGVADPLGNASGPASDAELEPEDEAPASEEP